MLERYLLKTVVANLPENISSKVSRNHRIAIAPDSLGVANELLQLFLKHGYKAEIAENIPLDTDVTILLDALAEFKHTNEAITVNYRVFDNVKRIADRYAAKGGLLVTVQTTGGQFGLTKAPFHNVWSAGLPGLIKTAQQEWPKAHCKAIDVELGHRISTHEIAERLFKEILNNDPSTEVGLLLNKQRIVLATDKDNSVGGRFSFNKNSVFIVTAGGRGVTASCIKLLAKSLKATFILLGRSALQDEAGYSSGIDDVKLLRQLLIQQLQATNQPVELPKINRQLEQILASREIKQTLAEIQASGSTAEYLSVDVLNVNDLTQALTLVRKKYGKITGVIHGAGVLADKLITQKTSEQFHKVFSTKVQGLKNLLEVTTKDPIELMVFFSSVAGRYGNPGQCDYAMANEVLNKVAQFQQQQRGKRCLVKSMNWGPWEGGMVTPELKKLFMQRGVHVIGVEEGTQAFVNEVFNLQAAAVEVVFGGELKPQTQSTADSKLSIHQHSHPYLWSHVIQEQPVLPACLVLDWFSRQTQKNKPSQSKWVCQDFKVLKGVPLPEFKTHGHHFSLQTQNSAPMIRLLGNNGIAHYSANMGEIPVANTSINSMVEAIVKDKQSWPWSMDVIYANNSSGNSLLFHGPDFQAIRRLDTFSPQGGSGELANLLSQLNWPKDDWAIDVLAADGALQMLRLWGYHYLQQPTLPTQIGEVILHQQQMPTRPLQCIFTAKTMGKYRMVADVLLLENNQPYLELRDAEMCVVLN